jgi:signal transduction histidine kinase/ligand-binding sensor domain-containing protein
MLCISPFAVAYHEFKRIGVDDGLPNATIYSVAQDKQGYIWLTSTNSGLLRYDGYSFAEFPVLQPDEIRHQASLDVGVLLIDRQANIWAGTWGYGLSRIDAQTGKLSRFVSDHKTADSLAGMQIQSLLQDSSGHIWIGTTEGLNRLSPDGLMQRIGAPGSAVALRHQRIWSLAQTEDGKIWIGTSEGLHSWQEGQGLSAVVLPFPQKSAGSRDNEIRALATAGHTLWLGTRHGLLSLDSRHAELTAIPFYENKPTPIINTMLVDSDGKLLLGTYNGLFRVEPEGRMFSPFRFQHSLLPSVNVRSLFLDRTGVLWLGSRESGLFYARHKRSAFSNLAALLPQVEAEKLNFAVTNVLSHQNILWLGSAEYVYRVDLRQPRLQRYLTAGRVNAIRAAADGQIYIATDVGLFRYLPDSDQLEKVLTPFQLAGIKDSNIRDLVITDQGQFWFGLWGEGVLFWDPATATVKTYLQQLLARHVGDAVQGMLVTAEDVWIGTRYSGLFQLNKQTELLSATAQLRQAGLQLPSADVQCVEQGPQQQLLICTANGLVLYDPIRQQQQIFDRQHGLTGDNIVGAYTDQQQNIWLLSAKGLTLKPAAEQRFINFTKLDGLVATELVFKSIFDDQNGQMYVGTINGLAIVEPDFIWVNDIPPKVAVSSILINNQNLPIEPQRSQWPQIQLQPTDSSIEFEFSSLDFHDVSRNQFRYRLKGFDQEWLLQTSKRSAYYSNLPAGNYQFELTGSNNHGLFSAEIATVTVEVLPPWWQKRWVQTLALLLFLVLILAIHQYRLRHIRQINRLLQNSVQERAKAQLILETKVAERTSALEESSLTLSLRTKQLEKSLQEVAKTNKELKRLDRLKDEFISTVSHELRTPLTSIRGAVGLVAQRVVEPGSDSYQLLLETAVNNCERLSHLINDLLDVQKFEAGKFVLEKRRIEVIEQVRLSLEAMHTYGHKYQVSLQLTADADRPLYVQADPLRLRQVLDNLLSNAIKFSHPAAVVTVQVSRVDQEVRVEVQDQGIGIPEQFQGRIFDKFSQADASDSRNKEGSGLGLTICKKIIESHQGRIGFHSQEQLGSTFWFTLPAIDTEPGVTTLPVQD